MNTKTIILASVLIAIVGGGVFLLNQGSSPTSSPLSGNERVLVVVEDLEDVSFCGQTFKAKQVYINGVSVIQRIAKITREEDSAISCERIIREVVEETIDVRIEKTTYPEQIQLFYDLNVGGEFFMVNADRMTVLFNFGMDGQDSAPLKENPES
jgi:hypothetical protein